MGCSFSVGLLILFPLVYRGVVILKYYGDCCVIKVVCMVKVYHRRKNDVNPPLLEMEIVLKKSGAYELRHFSILTLKALEEYHSKVDLPRKWHLTKDGKRLILE